MTCDSILHRGIPCDQDTKEIYRHNLEGKKAEQRLAL